MAKKIITDPAIKQAQKEKDKDFESGRFNWFSVKPSTVDSFGRSKVLRAKFKKKY